MTAEEIIESVVNNHNDYIQFAVADIDGVLRGKMLSKKKFLKGIKEGFGFCNVIFGWDVNDACYAKGFVSGWHTGFPDAFATLDLIYVQFPGIMKCLFSWLILVVLKRRQAFVHVRY